MFVSPGPLCDTRKSLLFGPYPMVWYQKLMSVSVSAGPVVWYNKCCVFMCRSHGVVPEKSCLYVQVPWCGTRSLSTLSATGCRRPRSTYSAACCALPAASASSGAPPSWTTTSSGPTPRAQRRPDTTCSMTKVSSLLGQTLRAV